MREMKLRKNEMKVRKKDFEVPKNLPFAPWRISISSVESPFLRQLAEIGQGELIAIIQGHYWSLEIMREASDRFAWIF